MIRLLRASLRKDHLHITSLLYRLIQEEVSPKITSVILCVIKVQVDLLLQTYLSLLIRHHQRQQSQVHMSGMSLGEVE